MRSTITSLGWPHLLMILGCSLAGNAASQITRSNASFDGQSGFLSSCVRLSGELASPASEHLKVAYDIALQLVTDDLQFEIMDAAERILQNGDECSGSFENGVYSDVMRVEQISDALDGRYQFNMTPVPGTDSRLQLSSDRLYRLAEEIDFSSAAEYSRAQSGDALLVIQHGRLLYEEYVSPYMQGEAHLLASGTKSFSAALYVLGAMDELWTLDEPVVNTITEWQGDSQLSQITIEHLLSLSSGLLDSDDYSAVMAKTLDTYDLAINHPQILYPAGEVFMYAPLNFQLLAAVFERKSGEDPVDYLHDRLFRYLDFSEDQLALWTRDVRGKPQMAGGAYFDARAWANYGQLVLQQGQWRGEQLLDANLLQQTSSFENTAFAGYGLTWWTNNPAGDTYQAGVDRIPRDVQPNSVNGSASDNAPVDTFFAAGAGKQRLYIIPSLNLVVVRFARFGATNFEDDELLRRVIAAL